MKPIEPSKNSFPLQPLLRAWQVNSTLPPRFEEQVWLRIAQQEALPVQPLRRFWEWLVAGCARPSFTFAYATVLVAVGLAGGLWHARLETTRVTATLGALYVRAVNPYSIEGR
jgi:hypothetical protein